MPWTDQIRRITPLAGQVLIKVIGATGDGKSSVIDALLDEKKLIPTSGMRACTSVVTEISYNHLEGPKYRAQVEFISAGEWGDELNVLLDDLASDHNSLNDKGSAASIALSKLQAVYPTLPDSEHLSRNRLVLLMSEPAVTKVLGTHTPFDDESGSKLHDKLKDYIDSKEKGVVTAQKMQLWPFIRKVLIQTRAKALETGSVIVDLPGLLDSNAARASIAQGYLRKCHVVWFVAAIIRAADSALARNFFDQELKRQLHLDGTIDRVTFICSKPDDVRPPEVRSSLSDGGVSIGELESLDAEKEAIHIRQADIDRLLGETHLALQEASEAFEEGSAHLRALRSLAVRARDGGEVWPLRRISADTRKRGSEPNDDEHISRRTRAGTPRAAARQGTPMLAHVAAMNRSKVCATFAEDKLQAPLRPTGLEALIENAEDGIRDLRNDLDSRRDQLRNLQEERIGINTEAEDLQDREWQACVALRNSHVKSSVRQQFASAINDFYTQKFRDDVQFDPSQHVFTKTEQAEILPVYCVSARGYEELRGWHQESNMTTYFSEMMQTEIPALSTTRTPTWKGTPGSREENVYQQGPELADLDPYLDGCSR